VRPNLPAGGVILWSGSIASIPAGYVLCDGDNGTPDLRNDFIVGAQQDVEGVPKSNMGSGPQQTGGLDEHSHVVFSDGNFSLAGGTDLGPSGAASAAGTNSDIGVTNNAAQIPAFFALAYIMKT